MLWEYQPVDRSSGGSILFANLYWILFASRQCTLHCNVRRCNIRDNFLAEKHRTLHIAHCTINCTNYCRAQCPKQFDQRKGIKQWIAMCSKTKIVKSDFVVILAISDTACVWYCFRRTDMEVERLQKRIKDETMPTVPLPCRSTVEMERYPFKGYHLKKSPIWGRQSLQLLLNKSSNIYLGKLHPTHTACRKPLKHISRKITLK